jgi:5'-3' exonuclease
MEVVNVHLIDGTYELFRAFYGAPSRRSPSGDEVGAAHGLVRSLLALLSDASVTHVAVAFDQVIESFRNELFDGYKTGAGIEPDLLAQFALAEDASRALGLETWPMREFEADDALASAAARFANAADVAQIVICSPDKDLAQCVRGSRVVCFDRMRGKLLDEAAVIAKFGVGPASIPDWLALVGDSADGIPGIPRWGAKSAAAVLHEYRHLEAIPDDPAVWQVNVRGAAALASTLAAAREDALLFRRLATLREDAPIAESLAALRWRGGTDTMLQALGARLGDANLPERVRELQRRRQAV